VGGGGGRHLQDWTGAVVVGSSLALDRGGGSGLLCCEVEQERRRWCGWVTAPPPTSGHRRWAVWRRCVDEHSQAHGGSSSERHAPVAPVGGRRLGGIL
jgi:hypothetical protein